MYLKDFEIRWSDVDANRHLANSAYINFMGHTRMAFLLDRGLDRNTLGKKQIGPVAFYEHVYYFKEVFLGSPVKVSLELKGLSEDGMFFEFHHDFYDSNGKNVAHCEMMGAWMSLKTRGLIGLPDDLLATFNSVEKAVDFRVLTKEDTRRFAKAPKKDLDPSL